MLRTWRKKIISVVASLVVVGCIASLAAAPVHAQEFDSGPGDAAAPVATALVLQPHASQWFKFDYKYDDSDLAVTDAAEVELTAFAEDALHFYVWTPENIQEWVNGEEVTPVGQGTAADGDEPAILSWVNGSHASETFYIVVENDSNESVEFLLTVSGDTVKF
jgi:hypothetical protein